MSTLPISGSVVSSMNSWITPQEQLEQLAISMVEEQVLVNKAKFEQIPKTLANKVAKCATWSILKCSGLSLSYDVPENLVPTLADLMVDQLMEAKPIPKALTNWYTARFHLGALPEKIPPLPRNIDQILNSKCPIYADKIKSDGMHYTIGDTHALQLLCQEDRTLNHFESNIVKPYGEQHYPKRQNPLQFCHFWDAARQEHGNVPLKPTHWVLMTKDILPGSREESYPAQVSRVHSLSQKAFTNYEVPSLQNAPRVLFLHKVATGESLYMAGNKENDNLYTYTRLQESTQDCHLVVGGFAPSGVFVDSYYYDYVSHGVGALRKF